jgi:hypothetical protein
MAITEILLSIKLKEAEQSLDLLGADRKVLKIAYEDLKNYEKFLSFTSNKTLESSDSTQVKMQLSEKEYSEEIEAFLSAWTSLWLKKWKQRFSLILGQTNLKQQNVRPEAAAKAQTAWTKLTAREEMIEMIAFTLIKNSEVCGTTVIAEDILRRELLRNPDLDIDCTKQVLALLNIALKKAHETSKRTGAIVGIKVDKNYYCESCQ